MLCKDIIKIIEQDNSPRYALSWDNVGLLAGRDDKEAKPRQKHWNNRYIVILEARWHTFFRFQ